MKFTIDIEKNGVEPLNLFFHSWEHDGKEIDVDPKVVRKLAIAVRNAIQSVLFVKDVKDLDELKTELEKATSGTKYSIEMTLDDAMLITAILHPDMDHPQAEKGVAALKRMETQVDQLVEGLDNEAEGKFH